MECQEFFLDHVILIAPRNNPWVSTQEIDPSDLIELPFIIREPGSGTRKVMLAELGKHDISLDDMEIVLEVGNAEAIVKAVEAGFGVSFVSRLAAEWALSIESVVEIPVRGVDLRRQVYMVRKHMQVPNRALEDFWGFVHDSINADLLHLAEK